ncbi:MAG: enoyl-CoA hydratase/isomerase family protein [Chloroflexota bacterium]
MAYCKIVLEKDNQIAKITLNKPQALNSVDEELLAELVSALDDIEKDERINVVILTGAGRAFSAGRDLKGILEGREWAGGSRYRVLEDLSKPVIAAVNGYCFTGSFELVMCADIIIASEKAIFADTHARFGVIPGGGQTQRLPRQIGPRKAKELMFTGDMITAREAERIGIVNRVVPPEELEKAAREMAEKILKNIPETIRAIKSLVNKGLKTDLASGLKMEAAAHRGPISPAGGGRKRISDLLWKK